MAVIVAWSSGFKDIKYDMPVCYEDHIYIYIYIYIYILLNAILSFAGGLGQV